MLRVPAAFGLVRQPIEPGACDTVSQSTPPLRRRDRRAIERRERPVEHRRAAPATRRPAWQSPFAIVSVGAVLVAAVVIFLNLPEARSEELRTPPTVYSDDRTNGEALGAADAPVVIELYSDFQCPFCAQLVKTLLAPLTNEFVNAGAIRIEAKDIRIVDRGASTESLDMAVGGVCAAEQDRYWQFHDLVFWNQGRENRGDHDAAFIARVADAAGVDRAAWDTCIADPAHAAAIKAQTTAALAAGVDSTPTLRINGQIVPGIPEYDQLAQLVRGLVADASASPDASGGPSPDASPTVAPSPS